MTAYGWKLKITLKKAKTEVFREEGSVLASTLAFEWTPLIFATEQ